MFNQLRETISADHIAIEKTPYAVAMAEGSIGREDYLFGLAQLYFIHDALEVSAAASSDLKLFFLERMVRTTAIQRDLAHFGKKIEDYKVLPETEAIAAEITRLAHDSPFNLLAHLYVLEGSRMGSLVLIKPLSRALNTQPRENQGIDYHIEGAHETPMRLKAWKGSVANVAWEPKQIDAILVAANLFMRNLCELYAVLPVSVDSHQRAA